jgi:hypothetical protein
MNDLPFYEIEASMWCSLHKGMVKLALQSSKPFKSAVKGKPVYCSFENQCQHREDLRCYLKAVQIEIQRVR